MLNTLLGSYHVFNCSHPHSQKFLLAKQKPLWSKQLRKLSYRHTI